MDANITKIIELTQLIAQDEGNVEARLQRAELLISMMQLEEAIEDIDFVNGLDPQNAQAYKLKGAIKMQQGDKAGAAADLRKAMELDPNIVTELEGKFSQLLPSCH